MSVFCSCGRKSRLDVADPGKARREAAAYAVLKQRKRDHQRRYVCARVGGWVDGCVLPVF